jgi:hypothetical protein
MKQTSLSRSATIVAIAAVIFWAVFSVLLVRTANTTDEILWTRLAWIFGSVQALAFAAAGALFGTAVQRDRAEKAEERAASAQSDADAQRDDASKGRALAAILQAEAEDSLGDGGGARRSGAPAEAPPDAGVRQSHARIARSLFGDLVN